MRSILLAETLRGPEVESTHFGAFAVADSDGRVVLSGGDAERAVFPRSAIKAFQALPLLLSGTADRYGLTGAELALACASHVGSPVHTEAAAAMLARAGRDESCLECGVQQPSSDVAARALAAQGGMAGPLHNNCSGKHAGFVCTAVAGGQDPTGYVAADHAVMRAVTACVAAVTDERLDRQRPAIDGCSIPAYRIPLRALAAGFARFATGRRLPQDFAAASARLRHAVASNPVMVAGDGRFDTLVATALGETAFVKVGAEGVYCAGLPTLGLGFALKCDDGAVRAAEVAAAALLRHLLGAEPILDRLASPVLRNWAGLEVGGIRPRLME